MRRLLLIVGSLTVFGVAASAAPITYNTVGSQLCVGANGCGVLTQTINDVTITFNPITSSTVLANPTTFGSFGEITVSCVGGGTGCANTSLSGLNLYLNITQSVPTSGQASLSGGVITGSISGTASSAVITWALPNTAAIGTVGYSVANNPLALVPPSVNGGTTSVQAGISDQSIPEPSAYLLISGSLLGLGLLRRRT